MHAPLPRRVAIHRDVETYSRLDLPKVGAHRYAQDPSTGVWCMAFAIDDGPGRLWWPGDPVPAEFIEAAANPSWTVVAHNDEFESAIEQHILAPRYGFPLVPLERHRCTMAMALALALPAGLEKLADALELEHRKDAAGERLMRQLARSNGQCKDPAQLAQLGRYCVKDVLVEREAHDCMSALSPAEQALWVLSCQINARGFHVDRAFAGAAQAITRAATPETDAALAEITGGAVTKATQVDRLKVWLEQQDCTTETLGRKAIEKLLGDPALTAPARRALELRQSGAQAATKKIDALFARAGEDDRIRGAFRYCGAGTGRWTGNGYQPQNLKKPVVEDLDAAIAAVATGDLVHMKTLYAQPLSVVGDCSRPTIAAALGHGFIGADLSAIESRVLAWTAGEEWKLEAYRQFDATQDPRHEPYCEIACKIFGVPSGSFTKGSPERDIGKTCDLAFGYMGSVGAWRKFQPDKFTDDEVQNLKNDWRAAHPVTVAFWYALDRAALRAVRKRGEIIPCGCVEFQCSGMFLKLKLPSGRQISYPYPGLVVNKYDKFSVVFRDNAKGQFEDYRGGDGAYGGTWCENLVQGIARDVLAEAMLRLEAAGYPIVLHVHDEIVAEVPIGFGSMDEVTELMTRVPSWAEGLPIAANAWTGPRYRK